MNRTTLPEVIKGLPPLPNNITRVHTKPRTSLWDTFFTNLEAGDSFEIEPVEVNTVKTHAAKYGFRVNHKRTETGKVLAQVFPASGTPVGPVEVNTDIPVPTEVEVPEVQ